MLNPVYVILDKYLDKASFLIHQLFSILQSVSKMSVTIVRISVCSLLLRLQSCSSAAFQTVELDLTNMQSVFVTFRKLVQPYREPGSTGWSK